MPEFKQIRVAVASKDVSSFWRCGNKFTREPRVLNVADLGAGDLQRLQNEPMLKVEVVGGDVNKTPDKSSCGKDRKKDGGFDFGTRGFGLTEAERAAFSELPDGEPVKLDSADYQFSDRPEWASKGTIWYAAKGEADAGIFDVKRDAEAFLKT